MKTPKATVMEFWRLMASNDFQAVKQVLAESFILEWPQSNERIRGPDNFAHMNETYPSNGRWQFTLQHLVASGQDVVTHVAVTDGVQAAEAISFFTVQGGKIVRLTEFWPESYRPPADRAHLTEPITN